MPTPREWQAGILHSNGSETTVLVRPQATPLCACRARRQCIQLLPSGTSAGRFQLPAGCAQNQRPPAENHDAAKVVRQCRFLSLARDPSLRETVDNPVWSLKTSTHLDRFRSTRRSEERRVGKE